MGNTSSASLQSTLVDDSVKEELKKLINVKPPDPTTLEDFVDRSTKFKEKFPVDTARLKNQNTFEKNELEDLINSTYPLIHERLLPLLAKFLVIKRCTGTKKERDLYKTMDIAQLVDRLLTKRPYMFVGSLDKYVLRDGTFEAENVGGFDLIGAAKEHDEISINDYMSYDEMKLSALLSVSSKSHFINNGRRDNRGEIGEEGTFEKSGIIVGQVGARFQKPGKMDCQDCIISPDQNKRSNGYGPRGCDEVVLINEWAKLWGFSHFALWSETNKATNDDYYYNEHNQIVFNKIAFKARIRMPIEILIREASQRAKDVGKKAYIHVVGLGLGVWQCIASQPELYVDTWGDVLMERNNCLQNIGCIDFSWIPVTQCKNVTSGEKFPNTDVQIIFSKRSLHDVVPSNMLLVCNFAWDGNSLPGNEYWLGSLSSSGDPAAACSSGVAELHNAFVNPQLTATNLHIASTNGIIHVAEYVKDQMNYC